MKTLYYKATHSGSYRKAAEFLGVSDEILLPPTILAVRNGEIVGVLATYVAKDPSTGDTAPLAGPLKVEVEGHPFFIGRKLIEAYELEMFSLGIKAFWFCVESERKKWISTVRKNADWVEVHDDGKRAWFRRSFESEEQVS